MVSVGRITGPAAQRHFQFSERTDDAEPGLQHDHAYRGEMDFVDNQIDPETGTIQGRALISNPNGFLIPGLFARVRLLGSGAHEAVLIHEAAVLTDQDRKYVYVVNADNQALRRDVTLGREAERGAARFVP